MTLNTWRPNGPAVGDSLVSNSDGTFGGSAVPQPGTFDPSLPEANQVAFNQPNLAPGADRSLTVTGGMASTSNVSVDSKRQAVGWIPGTSIAIKNPA